jgi:hypothetical protein
MYTHFIYLVELNNTFITYPKHIWPILNELYVSFYDVKGEYSNKIKQENYYNFIEFEHFDINNNKIIIRVYGYIDHNKPGYYSQGSLPLTFFQVTSNTNFNKNYKRNIILTTII